MNDARDNHNRNKKRKISIVNPPPPPPPTLLLVAIHIGSGYFNIQNHSKLNELIGIATKYGFDYYNTQLQQQEKQKIICDPTELLLNCCIRVISLLEDSELTNAGYGSSLNEIGQVELEASCSISTGNSVSSFGSCASIHEFANPIQIAGCIALNRLYDRHDKFGRIKPLMLSGPGAIKLAERHGLKCEATNLLTEKSKEKYEEYSKIVEKCNNMKQNSSAPDSTTNITQIDSNLNSSTVGCIVVDSFGNIASGVSSGGGWLKPVGRIGSAAMYGAGCYTKHKSNISIGSSVSGIGEEIITNTVAKQCCDILLANEMNSEPNCISNHELIQQLFECDEFSSKVLEAGIISVICTNNPESKQLNVELYIGHSTTHFGYGYKISPERQLLTNRLQSVQQVSSNKSILNHLNPSSSSNPAITVEAYKFRFSH